MFGPSHHLSAKSPRAGVTHPEMAQQRLGVLSQLGILIGFSPAPRPT